MRLPSGRLAAVALVVCVALLVPSCSLFQPLSDAEANEVAMNVMTGVATAVAQGIAQAMTPSTDVVQPRATYTISYQGAGVFVSGNMTFDEATGTIGYDVTVTFSSYMSSTVTIYSGSAYYNFYGSASSVTGSYTGSMTVGYGGDNYAFGWNISVSSTSAYGTYTINGWEYDFSGTAPTGSGYPGGGGGGGGSAESGICVWASHDYGHGYVNIYVNSAYVGQLTYWFTSGEPNYGDSGTLTIDLPYGAYELYAETQDGYYYWGPTSLTVSSTYPHPFWHLG